MQDILTTQNGHEILNPTEGINAEEFKSVLGSEFGINGDNSIQRLEQFKRLSNEGIAIMLEKINMALQGSKDSLMSHDRVIKIGDKSTIPLEYRYLVFTKLIEEIRDCVGVNPARVGDVLALGVVLLHPFIDGNGRTARVLGLIFRDSYDDEDYPKDFAIVTESRDIARQRGGFMINGYIPNFQPDSDQSDPSTVLDYLKGLLEDENKGAYTSCYGQASLRNDA